MPSSITPTLSAAASQVATPQGARAEAQHAMVPTAAQLAQLSQEASQRTSTEVRPDSERAPQVPKKVEAGYTAQTLHRKKRKGEEEKESSDAQEAKAPEEKTEGQPPDPLDVTA